MPLSCDQSKPFSQYAVFLRLSGSPFAVFSDRAWYVYFNHGYSDYGDRDNGYAVRLVRGGN